MFLPNHPLRNLFKHLTTFVKKERTTLIDLPTQPFVLHKLTDPLPKINQIYKEDAFQIYRDMCIIRKMEDAIAKLYNEKLVRGWCHLCSGQEAVCVGVKSMLSDNDTVITSCRALGWAYVMGMHPVGIIGEVLGRVSGCNRGKSGPMHPYTDHFYGGHGVPGAHVPIGTGIGFSHKYLDTKAISVVCYGDGVSNQGRIFESFHLAKLWNLPVMYICENNLYGMATSCEKSSANIMYFTRGDDIPGIFVEGMDVASVRAAIGFARDYILRGEGPIILEVLTYRFHGHTISDSETSYRDRKEVKKVREFSDPIKNFRQRLISSKAITNKELIDIEDEVKKSISDAVNKCRYDTEPDLMELTRDVYSANLELMTRKVVTNPTANIYQSKSANR